MRPEYKHLYYAGKKSNQYHGGSQVLAFYKSDDKKTGHDNDRYKTWNAKISYPKLPEKIMRLIERVIIHTGGKPESLDKMSQLSR